MYESASSAVRRPSARVRAHTHTDATTTAFTRALPLFVAPAWEKLSLVTGLNGPHDFTMMVFMTGILI